MSYFDNSLTKQMQITKPSKLETQRKIKYLQPHSNGFISYYDTAVFQLRVYDPQQKVQVSQFFQDMSENDCNSYFISQNSQWIFKRYDSYNQTYLIKNDINERKFHMGCFFGYIGKYLISFERLETRSTFQYAGTKITKQDTCGNIIKKHLIQEQLYSKFQSFGKMYIVYAWNKLYIFLFNDRSIKHIFKEKRPKFNILFVKNNQILLTSEEPNLIVSIKRMNNRSKLIRRIKVSEQLRFQKLTNLILLVSKQQTLTYVFSFSKHRLVLLSSIYIKSVDVTNDQKYLFFTKERNLYTLEVDRVLKQLIC